MKLGIVAPFRVESEPLGTPAHAGIQAAGPETAYLRQKRRQVEADGYRVAEFEGRGLIWIHAPEEPGLEDFIRMPCRRHAGKNLQRSGFLQLPARGILAGERLLEVLLEIQGRKFLAHAAWPWVICWTSFSWRTC